MPSPTNPLAEAFRLDTQKRATTIDDLARIKTVSDPQICPDGSMVVYVVKTTDLDKNRYNSHVWVVPAGGQGAARQWTRSALSEGQPRWSTDGRSLLFTSGREEKVAQIFVLPTDGGEAEKVTDLPPGGIGDVKWSPDGKRVAFTFRPTDEEWREAAVEERKKASRSAPPREITRRHYREEGTGFTPKTPYQLQVLDLATRAVTPITDGKRDVRDFCWSPDGEQVAFTRNVAEGDPDLLPNAIGLFVQAAHPLAEGEAARRIDAPGGPKYHLAWSPDGKYIGYLGHDRETEVWGVTNAHPWAAAVDGSGARDLTPDWDVACGNAALGDVVGSGESGPFWAADSRSLLVLASSQGAVDVYRVGLEGGGGTPEPLTRGTHAITGFTTDDSSTSLALLRATPMDAGDVYVLTPGSDKPRQLTRINEAFFAEVGLPEPVYFEAEAPGGHTVPCWVVLPEGDGPHPTILYIHGGPHTMYAHALFHEYAALAAAGYVVLYPNPRGSKGYGEEWTGAIKGDWGVPAQEDCLACVDHAIARGWTNGERLGVAGGSYGGYLTGWIIGNSDRFKAAVAERGVFNLQSMAGTCDFVWRDHDYFDADTTTDPAEYLRNSPLTYANNVTAATLIIHSEGDLRCPIEQAEQFFTALKLRGKDVVFLRYGPEANHNLSRSGPPDLRLHRQRRIHAWFDKYLKTENEDKNP
jgi:dipeptidyl aminopeptidase/acylaminoacyl peptidase